MKPKAQIGNKKPAWRGGLGQGGRGGASRDRTYCNTQGKPVAVLDGTTLRKRVRGSVHMLRRPPGWAVDLAILEQARQDGAQIMEILDSENHRVYRASLTDFDRFGLTFDRGFGTQVVLPLAHWRIEAQDARQLSFAWG